MCYSKKIIFSNWVKILQNNVMTIDKKWNRWNDILMNWCKIYFILNKIMIKSLNSKFIGSKYLWCRLTRYVYEFFVGHKRGDLPQVIICKKSHSCNFQTPPTYSSHNYLWPLSKNTVENYLYPCVCNIQLAKIT